MAGSALVVNHQVMLSTAANHSAIGSSRLLYIANRQGAVTLKTEDDLRIAVENERMARLGYIEFRPGSVKELNAGHALFDQHGIPSRIALQKELTQTDSAIITTVVSVRREDAHALSLSTKQDWERLLRSNWNKHIEELDVISPENVRWCAALHVNQQNNIHVHVFSWDDSGEFNRLLPKKQLVAARENFVAQALKPHQQIHNLARTQARDNLMAALKDSDVFTKQMQEQVSQVLPETGSLKYASLVKKHPEARAAIDEAVTEVIHSDPELQNLCTQYRVVVAEHARLKSLTSTQLEAYTFAAERDLHTRVANTLIARTKAEVLMPSKDSNLSPNDDLLILPKERKQLQAFTEELSSYLSPKEQRIMAANLKDAVAGKSVLMQEAIGAIKHLPSVKAADVKLLGFRTTFAQAVNENAHLLKSIFASGIRQAKKRDFADEAGAAVQRAGTRALMALSKALYLSLVRKPIPAPKVDALTQSVVTRLTQKG